jgi:coenzyme F420-dependent glucose-6-phosphate dehydrogenase
MGGDLSTELELPRDFESVAQLVREEDLDGSLVLGNDPGAWREHLDQYERAGFTHVALHHVGTDQRDFVEFAAQFV